MTSTLAYGTESVSFEIPSESQPKDLPHIEPRKVRATPEILDVEGSIRRALENPIDSPRLRGLVKNKRVALIVSDEFRSGQQEIIIKAMLSEIAAGKPKEVRIFCATGSHDPEIYARGIGKWAEEYATALGLSYQFYGHDCLKDDHIEIGHCSDSVPVRVMKALLECDVRAYGHESKHHYMNGYSCIDKLLLPGLSQAKTIELNHKNALDDQRSFGGRNVWAADESRRQNPFSIGCCEAREMADRRFIDGDTLIEKELPIFGLDMISDKKHIYWAASGKIASVSKQMTQEVDKMSAFHVDPTRYVVISPGGPPASQTIYSTQNCFDMALSGAIEDGGEALIIAPCDGRPDVPEATRGLAPDDKAKRLFYDNLAKLKDLPLKEATDWIDKNFELYLWKTDRVIKLMKRRKISLYLHSSLPDEKVTAIGFIPVPNVQEWIDERTNRNDSKIRTIDQGNKILVLTNS